MPMTDNSGKYKPLIVAFCCNWCSYAGADLAGKKPGRGAYVCHDVECLKKARKSRALERAFSTAIPPEVYDAMEAELEGHNEQE